MAQVVLDDYCQLITNSVVLLIVLLYQFLHYSYKLMKKFFHGIV